MPALLALSGAIAALASARPASALPGPTRSACPVTELPASNTPRRAQPRVLPQLAGKPLDETLRLLGRPFLLVREGEARKLQYHLVACTLDLYLYPTAKGGEPLADYADARRGSDGRSVSLAPCIAQVIAHARSADRCRMSPASAAKAKVR